MLSTKALLINTIFAKTFNPPLIDARESQRLLKALTVSFRTHLDREHGYIAQATPPPNTNPYTLQSSVLPTGPADADRRPTDRHVRAILSNPLFSYAPQHAKRARRTSSSGGNIEGAPRPAVDRDPIDVFDEAVAKGLMTPQRATGVLIAKRQAIAQSSSVSVNEAMGASGTAHRVVSWLRSSGLERNPDFVNHQALIDQLIPFMVEEGLENIVWMWLDQWFQRHALEGDKNHSSWLLTALVRAKVSVQGTTLDSGYSTILRADDLFKTRPGFCSMALKPWTTLSMLSTVFAWQRTPPSEKLFNSFAAMSGSLERIMSSIRIDRAHLDLYHPTHPDATAALQYLKSSMVDSLSHRLDMLDRRSAGPSALNPLAIQRDASEEFGLLRGFAKKLILLGTDTAEHLTRNGNEAEAEWVGNVLLEKFGDFLRQEGESASPDVHRLGYGTAV